jgi:hypothetical protein
MDQTDLNVRSSLLLKVGGGRICEVDYDWWRSLGERSSPLGGRPATGPDSLFV